MLDTIKKDFTEISPAAKMLNALSKIQKYAREILVFGCGTDPLPRYVEVFFPGALVTAYDIDPKKIILAEKIAQRKRINNLLYTSQKPLKQFEIVLVSYVLHHNPEELGKEATSFITQEGLIGILDYDMKNLPRETFFRNWGKIPEERTELEKIGFNEAFRLHTTFGLEDCRNLMTKLDINYLDSQGRIKTLWNNFESTNFYFIGRKRSNIF